MILTLKPKVNTEVNPIPTMLLDLLMHYGHMLVEEQARNLAAHKTLILAHLTAPYEQRCVHDLREMRSTCYRARVLTPSV